MGIYIPDKRCPIQNDTVIKHYIRNEIGQILYFRKKRYGRQVYFRKIAEETKKNELDGAQTLSKNVLIN